MSVVSYMLFFAAVVLLSVGLWYLSESLTECSNPARDQNAIYRNKVGGGFGITFAILLFIAAIVELFRGD